MKKPLAILCLGLTLTGCANRGGNSGQGSIDTSPGRSKTQPVTANTIAIVNGQPIDIEQLQKPLIESFGLNVLLNLVQLEMAKQTAARNGVSVTEADVKDEMKITLDAWFKENNAKGLSAMEIAREKGDLETVERIRKDLDADNQVLLDQALTQQKLTRAEFDIVIRTNAHLRKIVEPTLKNAISEKMLEDGFRFRYGEKVEVRHIQCANWQEIAEAKKMIAGGQEFGEVAKVVSRNARTGPLGGQLRPFSRQEPGLSDAFKDAAFTLKVGEVSDTVITNGAYHLIKLERRIDPVAVNYADHKEAIRRDLNEAMLNNNMKQLRNELAQDALKSLKITEPTLKAQFEKRMAGAKAQIQGRDEALKKLTEEREAAERIAATQPGAATQPSTTTTPADPAAPGNPPTEPATQPAPVPPTAPAAQ